MIDWDSFEASCDFQIKAIGSLALNIRKEPQNIAEIL